MILICTNCNQDPIFITEGIEIEEETDGSTLTVHNLQLEDQVQNDVMSAAEHMDGDDDDDVSKDYDDDDDDYDDEAKIRG